MSSEYLSQLVEAAILYNHIEQSGPGHSSSMNPTQITVFRLGEVRVGHRTVPTKLHADPEKAIELMSAVNAARPVRDIASDIKRLREALTDSWVPDAVADAKANIPLLERKLEKALDAAERTRRSDMPLSDLFSPMQKVISAREALRMAKERLSRLESQQKKYGAVPPNAAEIEAKIETLTLADNRYRSAQAAFSAWLKETS